MARGPRDTSAGIFHVYTHSVWAAAKLFLDDNDRAGFLRELARATAKVGWTCREYCLMGSHYHLLLEVDDGALPLGMHALNFRYAMTFNGRHAMRGHVFGARYGARRVEDEGDLTNTFRYIALNPVEAGLCDDPASWPWSSYAGTIGVAQPSSFVDATTVLRCFGGGDEISMARLRRYVEGT